MTCQLYVHVVSGFVLKPVFGLCSGFIGIRTQSVHLQQVFLLLQKMRQNMLKHVKLPVYVCNNKCLQVLIKLTNYYLTLIDCTQGRRSHRIIGGRQKKTGGLGVRSPLALVEGLGTKSPSGVQGLSPSRGSGGQSPEAEAFL